MATTSLAQAFGLHQQEMDNRTVSDKGDNAYVSTLKPTLDFYASMGALRGKEGEFLSYLRKSFDHAPLETMALIFKLRDVRNGMGERNLFRLALSYLEDKVDLTVFIPLIAKYGRFDDYFALTSKESIKEVVKFFISIIRPENDEDETSQFYRGLLAKWLPRKPKNSTQKYLLSLLRKELKVTPKEFRQWMVRNSNVVEQLMCSNNWSEVPYSNLPSQAAKIYRNAFMRHDESRYLEYIVELTKPVEERQADVKINAGAIFPYQIMNSDISYETDQAMIDLATAQWNALPDFLNGDKTRILPMIDVSGSMDCSAGGNIGITCMDVAISLGAYLAQRQEGALRGSYLTFSEKPVIGNFDGFTSVQDIYTKIKNAPWGYNTDIAKALELILDLKVKYDLSEDAMPEVLVILSDMNFDDAVKDHSSMFGLNRPSRWETNYQLIQQKYQELGLTPPKIVYWNLNHNGTFTCTVGSQGVCQISGFSPSVFKDVLSTISSITPESVFLKGIASYLDDVKSTLGERSLNVEQRTLTYPHMDSVNRQDMLEALATAIFSPGATISISPDQIGDYLKDKKKKRINISVSSSNI